MKPDSQQKTMMMSRMIVCVQVNAYPLEQKIRKRLCANIWIFRYKATYLPFFNNQPPLKYHLTMALISNGDCEEAFSVPRHCRLIQPENCQFVQFVHIHGASNASSISTHGLETLRNQVTPFWSFLTGSILKMQSVRNWKVSKLSRSVKFEPVSKMTSLPKFLHFPVDRFSLR